MMIQSEFEKEVSLKPKKVVTLSKLVERGHLHVLKYLYEELHYFLGLQRYCKPAIEYGKIEILQWLREIGIMDNDDLCIGFMDDAYLKNNLDYCECAIKSGNVQSLKWLLEIGGYKINDENSKVLAGAISTKSLEMIQYCFDLGYDNFNAYGVKNAIENTGSVEVFRLMYELGYEFRLQRYCKPAIEYGKIEILQWLREIGIMDNDDLCIGFMDDAYLKNNLDYCECAIKSGNVQSLKWLLEIGGYKINDENSKVLAGAISTKSLEMIQYCFDLGYDNFNAYGVKNAIENTGSVEVFRLMYELGYEFSEMKEWFAYKVAEYFEIIKFLRSISIPWCGDIMKHIVGGGTLEMIQYAHEDGCPWTTPGEEYYHLLKSFSFSLDKLNYLIDNGCTFDYENLRSSNLNSVLIEKKELGLLDYFIGKNSNFDSKLFTQMFKSRSNPWFEGISYLLEKGKDMQNFTSLEEVFRTRREIDGIKYFHSLGLPWCLDCTRNTLFLSQIACHVDLEDVKWAYENGCKGGDLVSYVKKEWRETFGIRHRSQWKANQAFFAENGLLDEAFLEKSGLKKLGSKNVQEIGDAQLSSFIDGYVSREDSFLEMDFTSLKNLVDHGFKFSSESEKESVCNEAYNGCCGYSQNEDHRKDYRKRLALFVGMGVRDL
ncbi:hypothetical protein CTEN210_04345 [Chaetoceros tenuissimus]|uniref:Ankyrin repeat protein n=1 Tax=Chaetoceros tenuissimus TaxID=426638 RepID=A0AAD3H2V1_9STRA|nr:hypothetical protein CTEN210_04345 [Chaetoceros tenuissimus]